MNSQRRLGRGLEALLNAKPLETPVTAANVVTLPLPVVSPDSEGGPRLVRIGVFDIDRNPFQPRDEFDPKEIANLAESLRQHGMLQPIAVRQSQERYQLIAGERRLRAAIEAGWNEVPAQVLEVDDREMAEMAIIENLHRRDLNPMEKALSFARYIDTYQCKQEELSRRISVDRTTIANLIRLLELPTEVQGLVRSGALTQGHARALLPLDEETQQIAWARRIQSESLSVRAVEEAIARSMIAEDIGEPRIDPPHEVKAAPPKGRRKKGASPHAEWESNLRRALGTRCEIRASASGRGKITLHFASRQDFERLYEALTLSAVPTRV